MYLLLLIIILHFLFISRVKANNVNMKVDLFINGELLDPADDKKLVSQLPLRDKMVHIVF